VLYGSAPENTELGVQIIKVCRKAKSGSILLPPYSSASGKRERSTDMSALSIEEAEQLLYNRHYRG
jgi:hypothetical protein